VSGAKVVRYSEESRYSWDVRHDDIDLQLGGIHQPVETYVRTFEEAGLNLDTLREISVGPWDPMSLAMRVTRVSD
jgi:hypothetical protein